MNEPSQPLRLLIVEDNPQHAELLLRELRRGGFAPEWRRVETEEDYLSHLHEDLDIILSDYSLPVFSGARALELLKARGLDVPFIIISGTIGEETAVNAMKLGATDYLLKDRMGRVGNAVEHALEQKRLRGEYKKAEAALVQERNLLRTLVDHMPAHIFIKDTAGRYLLSNAPHTELLGARHESDLIGKTVFDFFPAETALAYHADDQEMLRSGQPVIEREEQYQTGTGPGWSATTKVPLRDATGQIAGLVGIKRDITDRKRAEESLRESEARFRQLAESINEVFWMTDCAKNEMLYISPAYERIWGQTCQSLYDKPRTWIESILQDDRERVFQAAITKQAAGTYDEEYRIVRPDGGMRWIHDRAFPIRNSAGEAYRIVGVAEDITERKKLEAQFLQSQKMESIGQLAGGVAHDFNNLLTVIQGNCSLLLMDQRFDPELRNGVAEIESATTRAANLTRQLLAFSRRQTLLPKDLDLNHAVASMTKMLQRILGEDIRIQYNFSPQSLVVHADAGMLDQILLNLTVNSRDAMPRGGRLVIDTSSADFAESITSQQPHARPGSFVCLSITDTGCGIPREVLPRIFEPFFTTKEVGRGTGLGLATVYGIVQQHRGWIAVDSEIGQGTTFRVYLPRVFGTVELKPASTINQARGGHETILVVEDEPAIRGLVHKVLVKLGYRVLEAATGVAALEVWQQYQSEIALLLTDFVLPDGMTGMELARQLLEAAPRLRVIFTSGYSPEIAGRELDLQEGVNFLAKPFDPHKLAQAVRESLDQK